MGSKPPYNRQRDRPESGGADRDEEREKAGLERNKQLLKKQKSITRPPAKPGPAPENQADGAEEER